MAKIVEIVQRYSKGLLTRNKASLEFHKKLKFEGCAACLASYFALVNQFTSRPSRFDAARENFGPLVCSFRTFGTSYPAGADNHRGRNFNVFRPPVNPLDFTCCVCMLVVCCECLFFYIRQYTVKV
jgi:hypothetical protein